MTIRKILFSALGALSLAACAGPTPGSPEWVAQVEQQRTQAEQQRTAAKIDALNEDLPPWYSNQPADEFSIYGVGNAISSDLQFAEDKAILAAKRSLADRVASNISSKMKELVSESGDAAAVAESEKITTNLITEVNLAGYNIVKRKFTASGTKYRVYVLLQYPVGKANRQIVEKINADPPLRDKVHNTKAFQELEQDIKDARQPPESKLDETKPEDSKKD